jgi:hypothetical protein
MYNTVRAARHFFLQKRAPSNVKPVTIETAIPSRAPAQCQVPEKPNES